MKRIQFPFAALAGAGEFGLVLAVVVLCCGAARPAAEPADNAANAPVMNGQTRPDLPVAADAQGGWAADVQPGQPILCR